MFLCPPYRFCGCPHRGYSDKGKDKCFKYGQAGHRLRDCQIKEVAMRVNQIHVSSSSAPTPGGVASMSVTALGFSVSQNRLYALAYR